MSFATQYEKIFGERYVKESYKMISHSFNKRIVRKQYCSKCGLLSLNNEFSRWAVKMGCNNIDHPAYKSQRNKASLVK